ncbi:hypothetical protein [Sphingomonas kyeonggiensis]|uniref:Uncharacterized protein n=1 Tax=Sphingomonas kyeonggiensis TaxID=1268553 RepID=A0A7W6JUK1_9SPHN|nr:hypothetical protein [Sphingomonas kyeonggiensis]MBB4099776.1 hypothetical protein [Sphingomonas kyeonggiensis]
MADMTSTRRGVLGAMAVACSVSAVPAIASRRRDAASWDQFIAGMAMVDAKAVKSAHSAKAAGMRPEWLCGMTKRCSDGNVALLFDNGDAIRVFSPSGERSDSNEGK